MLIFTFFYSILLIFIRCTLGFFLTKCDYTIKKIIQTVENCSWLLSMTNVLKWWLTRLFITLAEIHSDIYIYKVLDLKTKPWHYILLYYTIYLYKENETILTRSKYWHSTFGFLATACSLSFHRFLCTIVNIWDYQHI